MSKRNLILFINPPCTSTELDFEGKDPFFLLRDASAFPHLGILSLASYVEKHSQLKTLYLDGDVCSDEMIGGTIRNHHHELLAVCTSAITENFGAGVRIAKYVKQIDPEILNIMGNDHFSALAGLIMDKYPAIDFGFVGNDVHGSLTRFLQDAQAKSFHHSSSYPGLVYRDGRVKIEPVKKEELDGLVDYEILDRLYPHRHSYESLFQKHYGDMHRKAFGRDLKKGVGVEFARGCLKFKLDQPCSFCCIRHDGVWGNQAASAKHAWEIIENAVQAGHDYIVVTADELPLTFPGLLKQMAKERPSWHKAMPESTIPVLMGYARVDGLLNERAVAAMRAIGFRDLFVGIDAADPLSLLAMKKPLRDTLDQAKRLFNANKKALEIAATHDMVLSFGLVVGHMGMNKDLLERNEGNFCEILDFGTKCIGNITLSSLLPFPGSQDHRWLTHPKEASAFANTLGLDIADVGKLQQIANVVSGQTFEGTALMEAVDFYREAFMPSLSHDEIQRAKARIANHAVKLGIYAEFNY